MSCPRVGRDKIVAEKQWLTYPLRSLCQHPFEIDEVDASQYELLNVVAGLAPAKGLKRAEHERGRAQWAKGRWDLHVELGIWQREKWLGEKVVRAGLGGDLREERRKGPVGRRIRGWVGKRKGSLMERKYEWDSWVGEWSIQEIEEESK